MTFSHFLPFRGVEMGDTSMLASLLPFRAGWGGRWLAGSFPVLRPCRRAGRGGGQGTALTHDNLSYVPSQHSLTLYPKHS